MRVLLLTKIRYPLLKEGIKNVDDYLSCDDFFFELKVGLEKRGHEVIVDSRNIFFLPLFVIFRFPKIYKWVNSILAHTNLKKLDSILLSKSVLKKVKRDKIDLIITEINEYLTISSIIKLKKMGVTVTEWFGLFPENVRQKKLESLNHYSHVWCPADYIEVFRKYGIYNKNIHYINSAFSSHFLYNEYDQQYEYDVCFVGGITKLHYNRIEILEFIARNVDNFVFYGYGIDVLDDDSPLRACFKGWANINTIRKLFSSSKIAINLTLDNYTQVKRGFNQRLFEIPACKGALQIAKFHENIKEFFFDDEIVMFYDKSDLIDKINYYLKNSREREFIVKKAYLKNQDNSLDHRIDDILSIINY